MGRHHVASRLLAMTIMFSSKPPSTSTCALGIRSASTTTARKTLLNDHQHGRHSLSPPIRGCTRLTSSKTIDDVDKPGYSSIPQQYVKSYRLDGVGEGSRVDITTDTGHALATDVPKKMGGQDSAPQPVETLLAAWMGCTQATALFVGRQMRTVDNPRGVQIHRLEFDDIRGFRDERGALELPIEKTPAIPSRLQRITGTIRVVTAHPKGLLKDDQLHVLKEQTEARCPVANMILSSGCTIDVDWVSAE